MDAMVISGGGVRKCRGRANVPDLTRAGCGSWHVAGACSVR